MTLVSVNAYAVFLKENEAIVAKPFSEKAKKDLFLVDLAKKNNDKAFAELMQRYRKPLYNSILKMVRNHEDAEDITLISFTKAYRNLHKFNAEHTFGTWLFRIGRNTTIDLIRRKKDQLYLLDMKKDSDGEAIEFDFVDTEPNPESSMIKNERVAFVKKAVKLLPLKYQDLVKYRYFDQLKYDEIAEKMQLSVGTVKAQLFRSRTLLIEIVEKQKNTI